MQNLYDEATADALKTRILQLRPDSPRQWGTMNAPQAMAHCVVGMETAVGDQKLPRLLLGRLLGAFVKPTALGGDQPMRKNSPTAPAFIIIGERQLGREQARLIALVDRFVRAGPAGCTTHPHVFFGPMTPAEWAVLMYKHLDHHLRQFGV